MARDFRRTSGRAARGGGDAQAREAPAQAASAHLRPQVVAWAWLMLLGASGCPRDKPAEEAQAAAQAGSTVLEPIPEVAAPPKPAARRSRPATIAVSGRHVCALSGGGEVACWGSGRRGQLAPGVLESSSVPVPVPGIRDAVAVVTPGDASCALHKSGAISCWGNLMSHSAGQSELWTTSALGDVVELVAGRYRADNLCARRRDGTIACLENAGFEGAQIRLIAGFGGAGEPAGAGAIALAGASDRMCALDSDHELRCWRLWGVDAYAPTTVAGRYVLSTWVARSSATRIIRWYYGSRRQTCRNSPFMRPTFGPGRTWSSSFHCP